MGTKGPRDAFKNGEEPESPRRGSDNSVAAGAKAMRTAWEIECGEIYVNRPMGQAFQAHHIGHTESGQGGEDSKNGVLKCTQLKTVYCHDA